MNYKKVYYQIINRALSENRIKGNGIYYESHHILPKCCGGSNLKENLVLLSAREHFIVHKMLPMIYPEFKKELSLALHRMTFSTTEKMNRDYHIGAREFERIRKEIGESISGESNPFFNQTHTEGSIKKISESAIKRFENPQNHPNFGKPRPQETREKIRQKNKGRIVPQEEREKMSNARKGKPKSRQHVINQANSTRGKKRSEETKNKLRVPKPKHECSICGQLIGGMSNLHQHLTKKHQIPTGKWGMLLTQ